MPKPMLSVPPSQIAMVSGSVRYDPAAASAVLLPVAHQDLIAGRAQLGTILLQAGQNDEVALIHEGAAKFLDIARTSLLLLLRAAVPLLRESAGGDRQRQQAKCQEKFTHRIPSF